MRMVIVEDEPVQRAILTQAFLNTGNEVHAFSTAEGAVDFLRSWQPEIVICDLELIGRPGEDVAEAADALALPAWIILLSVDGKRLERAQPLADVLLRKPFALVELTSLVEGMRLSGSVRSAH
jgi:DNA-binding response OmpR family regulator